MSASLVMIPQPSTLSQSSLQAILNIFIPCKLSSSNYGILQAQIKKTDALQAIKDRKNGDTSGRMPSQMSQKTALKITPPTPML
jgi:hypothetical protein